MYFPRATVDLDFDEGSPAATEEVRAASASAATAIPIGFLFMVSP
jgi:hypothetical protein